MKSLISSICLAAFLGLVAGMFFGCPAGIEIDPARKAELEGRLARLDVTYEVLEKDSPSQSDTLSYRRNVTDARQALSNNRLDQAEKSIASAEAWISDARVRYYQKHQNAVLMGGENPEELMKEAEALLAKAKYRESIGEDWAAEIYGDGAVEQGELALMAAKSSAEHAAKLVEVAPRLEAIYREVGKPQDAARVRSQIKGDIQENLFKLAKMIEDRLSGKEPGYSRGSIESMEDFKKKSKEIDEIYNGYKALADAGEQFAPGELRIESFELRIKRWNEFYTKKLGDKPNVLPGNTVEDRGNDPQKVMQLELAQHNREYRSGAQPLAGTGIILKETEIMTEGSALVVRGYLQNARTEPIYRPRVTVVGNVYSDVVDLQYAQFNPQMTTSFLITIKGISTEAATQSGALPRHELVVIFKERNGVERKLITSTIN